MVMDVDKMKYVYSFSLFPYAIQTVIAKRDKLNTYASKTF